MVENWRPVVGWEERYQVSDLGSVKSVPFMQRYLLRNGKVAYRLTAELLLSTQVINSGYQIVHLYLNNQRTGRLVHRLVAAAFLPNPGGLPEVNHIDGNKANCAASNLEWATRSDNKLHAVEIGLHGTAEKVTDPLTGVTYPSITQAAKDAHLSHRKVRATFLRGA